MALLAVASENTAIAAIFVPSTTYYLSLHSATPAQTGTNEISGGSYARQVITFGSASGGSEASTNSQTFTNLPVESGGIPYFGIWDSLTAGNYKGGGTTTGLTGSLPAGISVNFATGAVTVAIA